MFLKPGDTVDVRPDGEEGPVYRLRTPLLYDRVKLEQAITRHGGRKHGRVGLLRALRRDVAGDPFLIECEPEERVRLNAQIDAALAAWQGFGKRVRDGEFRAGEGDDAKAVAQSLVEAFSEVDQQESPLAGVEALVRGAGGHYAAACAEETVYQEIAAIESARLFLVGWEGLEATFRRGPQGVPDDVLMAIPPAHLAFIGAEAEKLLKPDEATVKNSAGPSSGASARARSTATKTRRKKLRSHLPQEKPTGGTSKT